MLATSLANGAILGHHTWKAAMKKTLLPWLASVLLLVGTAWGQTPSAVPTPSHPQINVSPQVFTGSIFQQGFQPVVVSGSLQASNSTCLLSVTGDSNGFNGEGNGPDGLFFGGSKACPGAFELHTSVGNPIGNASGVLTGTFVIVKASDHATVAWAGTYTQVMNFASNEFAIDPCTILTFCANLGPAFDENGLDIGGINQGLAYLLELDGLNWSVPSRK
jgi:hypothetical protein